VPVGTHPVAPVQVAGGTFALGPHASAPAQGGGGSFDVTGLSPVAIGPGPHPVAPVPAGPAPGAPEVSIVKAWDLDL
jgi:hypothetical protein